MLHSVAGQVVFVEHYYDSHVVHCGYGDHGHGIYPLGRRSFCLLAVLSLLQSGQCVKKISQANIGNNQ